MEEKALKTSWKQRIVILVIAVLLVGSTILTYALIVLGGNNSSSGAGNDADSEEIIAEYNAKTAELEAAAKPLSDKYFKDFSGYKTNVKAYNAANVNSAGLETKDLKDGSGRTLEEGDTDYMAYYIGWCPDGSIFDSSFDDEENPTGLQAPLDPSLGLIEGWNQGVIGMRLGGVRQLEISGSLAYGDTQEICGSKSSPLKFIVMALEPDTKITKINEELNEIYMRLYASYYGGVE